MLNKIAKIDNNTYRVNDCETPLDIVSTRELLKDAGISNVNSFMDDLDNKEMTFNVTSDKGTVVNVYEVDYQTSNDPNKETQEMSSQVGEYDDYVTQNLFPGVSPEDVVVTIRESFNNNQKADSGRLFTEKELRNWVKKPSIVMSRLFLKGTQIIPGEQIQVYPKGDGGTGALIDYGKVTNIDEDLDGDDVYQINNEDERWYSKADYDIVLVSLENPFFKKKYDTPEHIRNVLRRKRSSWKEILGMPTTAPAPVKEPKRETPPPEKPKRINPFKKPNIRPSTEPQPKALPVTYPKGQNIKMHPDLENMINKKNTPYHALPQIPSGEFIDNIASDRFKIIIQNLEKYSGKKVNTLYDVVPALQDVLGKVSDIEKEYIPQLEDLAVSVVEEYFGIEPGEVEFDAKMIREVSLENIDNLTPEETSSVEKAMSTSNIDLEVTKRRFINSLIQGAGINSLDMYKLVSRELSAIDPDLINMYGLINAFAEFGYWVTPPDLSGLALSASQAAGKVQLDFSQEKPKVVAVAINFPVLIQELVKGVMELMSAHGLPENEQERNQVLKAADSLEDESWDIRFGPEIWKKLLSHLDITELNGRALSILYHNLVQMDAASFSDLVYKILSNNPPAINTWNQMYNEALGQSKNSSLITFSEYDVQSELYNSYRKRSLQNNKTPKLFYEWLKNYSND